MLEPERISFCEHYHHKYLAGHTYAASDEPLILIEDHAQDIIIAFKRLVRENYPVARSLYRRLAIVAYGSKQAPSTPPKVRIPVLALASWGKAILHQLIKGEASVSV